jgi:hypothetical protein
MKMFVLLLVGFTTLLVGKAFSQCFRDQHPAPIVYDCACTGTAMREVCKTGGNGCDPTGTVFNYCNCDSQFKATVCTNGSLAQVSTITVLLKDRLEFPRETCANSGGISLDEWLESHPPRSKHVNVPKKPAVAGL